MTKGEFSINIIGGGALGGGDAIAKSVRAGSVEICNASGAILGGVLSPEFPLFDLPYLIKSWGHLMRVALGSPYIKKMHEIGLSKGVQVLTPFNGGLRHIFYRSTKPILKPEDLKGVKLRTMNAPLDVDMWNAAGAQATPLSYAEVYNALAQGVVDGIDNTFDAATSIKVDEVVKSVTKTAHRYQLNYVIANNRWFQSLPKQYQGYFVQVVEEAAIYATGYVMMNDEVRQPVQWAKKGIAIYEPDRKAFENSMMKVYSEFGPKVGGQEAIDAILKMQ
jgi:TRAP-type C4-dicarboxylate transport system substrate-binding protein